MVKQNKRPVVHDEDGNKIINGADAQRRKAKKRKLERIKKGRLQRFEEKLLEASPQEIEREINSLKHDIERKKAAKIMVTKQSEDRLTRLEAAYKRLKDKINERHEQRQKASKDGPALFVDFEELKVHRKSSIYYHPVNNPYGAPPNGQPVMYRHPDGSVKREPPAISDSVAPRFEADEAKDSDDSDDSAEDEEDDDDEGVDEPMLPADLPPGMSIPSSSSSAAPPGMPPLPPGPPPLGASGPPMMPQGQPPLPAGCPPLPNGQPPLPVGFPPLPAGQPPLPGGRPPLPFGQPPLPAGQPPMGFGLPGGPPGASAPTSQADFMAELVKAGFHVKGPPPGPPPKPGKASGMPGSRPPQMRPEQPPMKASAPLVADLPEGVKAPPPPPKQPKATRPSAPSVASNPPKTGPAAPVARSLAAATAFMPTSLRTKKPSQVAGSSFQVSAASLSMESRSRVISTEVPQVEAKVSMDDEFAAFLQEVGEGGSG